MSIRIACVFDSDGLAAFERDSRPGAIDILILPELFDGGYKRLHRDKGPMADIAQLNARFARVSAGHQVNLIAGTVAFAADDGRVRNLSQVFAHGRKIAAIPKTHLFRPLGDDEYFASGPPGAPFTLECRGDKVRAGVIVCYDLRFPELVRPWFKAGLDLLIVPARWPKVRDDAWKTLLCARAIENQCFTIGVNARDDEGGGSYAFAPDGRAVFTLPPAESGAEPAWQEFDLDLTEIATVKGRLDTRRDACLL